MRVTLVFHGLTWQVKSEYASKNLQITKIDFFKMKYNLEQNICRLFHFLAQFLFPQVERY